MRIVTALALGGMVFGLAAAPGPVRAAAFNIAGPAASPGRQPRPPAPAASNVDTNPAGP